MLYDAILSQTSTTETVAGNRPPSAGFLEPGARTQQEFPLSPAPTPPSLRRSGLVVLEVHPVTPAGTAPVFGGPGGPWEAGSVDSLRSARSAVTGCTAPPSRRWTSQVKGSPQTDCPAFCCCVDCSLFLAARASLSCMFHLFLCPLCYPLCRPGLKVLGGDSRLLAGSL